MLIAPGYASSDLRKSQKLASAEAAANPGWAGEAALLEASYQFCDAVLTARWAQVQALAGALLSRGTMDGRRLEALMSRLRRAQISEYGWWHVLASWPLAFGVIWSVVECPEFRPIDWSPPSKN